MEHHWVFVLMLAAISLFAGWMDEEGTAAKAAAVDHAACATSDLPTSRPSAGGAPTQVTVGVRIVDLTEISDVDQTLTAEFLVRQGWTDPRLARLEGCEVALTEVWIPRLAFVNSGRLFEGLPRSVEIGPTGVVSYLQTYYGSLSSYESLEEFPFDDHLFEVLLTSVNFSEDEVVIVGDDEFTGKRDLLNISDWVIGDISGDIGRQFVHATGEFHSMFTLKIPAERIKLFYIWKIFLPLCLIVAMSWAVFWLNPANFGPQIGLSATSMLTLIAFLFATTNMVPRLGYLTTFDIFLICCLVLVFVALLESLLTTYLVAHDRLQTAQRLDRASRVMFPAAFALIIVVILVL